MDDIPSEDEQKAPPVDFPWDELKEDERPSADELVNITDDGGLVKHILSAAPDNAEPPPVMSRVYVNVEGRLLDGRVFLNHLDEEFNFTLGRAETARGLEMSVSEMKCGERARIFCSSKYGFSKYKKPSDVPEHAPLIFDVTVRYAFQESFDKLSPEEKLAEAGRRRTVAKALFLEGKYKSAAQHYSKAVETLDYETESTSRGEAPGWADHLKAQADELLSIHLVNSATCNFKLSLNHDAIREYTRALTFGRDVPKTLTKRAMAHLELTNYSEAMEDLRQAKSLLEDAEEETAKGLRRQIEAGLKRARQLKREVDREAVQAYGGWLQNPKAELYPDQPVKPTPFAASCWHRVKAVLTSAASRIRGLCPSQKPKTA